MTAYTKVLAAVRREQMLPTGTSVTVGLSGGADSVALLHLLLSLQEELSLCAVSAVHINHGLRGEEAERDQRFVEELCRQWQVPLQVFTVDIAAVAAERGCGWEEAGREYRYDVFEQLTTPTCRVATAHTASDNVETVLLHLCRGSGIHGLAGIPPVRGNIIRPLIDCTRDDVERYCAEHGLSYVTDSTNTDVAYARNRIRQLVIPQLKVVNPQAEAAIGRVIARAREWDNYLSQQVTTALQTITVGDGVYDRHALQVLDTPIRSAVWRQLLGEHGRQRGSEQQIHAADALLTAGGSLSLTGGRQVSVHGKYVRVGMPPAETPPFLYDNIRNGDSWTIGDTVWRWVSMTRAEYEQKLNNRQIHFANACDCDKINGNVLLRQRLPADAYHPVGRGCGKTLKKLFNEAMLTVAARTAVPVLCDRDGIFLVAGFGCDERVRVTENTKTVMTLKKIGDT